MTDRFVDRPVLTFAVGVVGPRAPMRPAEATPGFVERRLHEAYEVIDEACRNEFRRTLERVLRPDGEKAEESKVFATPDGAGGPHPELGEGEPDESRGRRPSVRSHLSEGHRDPEKDGDANDPLVLRWPEGPSKDAPASTIGPAEPGRLHPSGDMQPAPAARNPGASFEAASRRLRTRGLMAAPGSNLLDRRQAPHRVRLLSGFADAAERVAALAAPEDWEVEAVLPMPRALVKAGYGDDDADWHALQHALKRAGRRIVELPLEREGAAPDAAPTLRAHEVALRRQGGFLLRQIDLLVAVWHGRRPEIDETRSGASEVIDSAAEAIQAALEHGVRVLWISSLEDREPWLLEHSEDMWRRDRMADALRGPLQDAVAEAVRPPGGPEREPEDEQPPAERRLASFFSEKFRKICPWFPYDALKRGLQRMRWEIPMDTRAETAASWKPFLDDALDDADFRARLQNVLLPRFHAADHVATYYSHAYRSTYVLAYALAALSVTVASSASALLGAMEINLKGLYGGVELLLIVGIIGFVLMAQRGRDEDRWTWHARWMDARLLAERLRHLRFLLLMGEGDSALAAGEFHSPGLAWGDWYLRATIREVGLPFGAFDLAFQRRALRATRDWEIREQIAFNEANHEQLTELHEWLQHTGDRFFFAAAGVLALMLALWLFGWFGPRHIDPADPCGCAWIADARDGIERFVRSAVPWETWISAVFPTFGAALAGIRFTGDFEGFARRSRQTAERLRRLSDEFSRAERHMTFDRAAKALEDTAKKMTDDLQGWQSIYALKRISLP